MHGYADLPLTGSCSCLFPELKMVHSFSVTVVESSSVHLPKCFLSPSKPLLSAVPCSKKLHEELLPFCFNQQLDLLSHERRDGE